MSQEDNKPKKMVLVPAPNGPSNVITAVALKIQSKKDSTAIKVQAPALIQQSFGKSAAEIIVWSTSYRDALLQDFKELPIDNPEMVDKFFALHGFPHFFAHSPSVHVAAWEHVLSILLAGNEQRYRDMHKGTPFYFAGTASYLARDFEKALFYMDAALEEDLRLHKIRWANTPSGRFVLLDSDNPEQFARPLVAQTRALFEGTMAKVSGEGGIGLSVDDFRNKLVRPAMSTAPQKRSAVTGLISFLLEFPSRKNELLLAGSLTSTAESFFLHLFKGTVLFETLLKTSIEGSRIQSSKPRATIDDFLRDPAVYSALGFVSVPQGLGGDTLEDVFGLIEDDETSGLNYAQKAIRATWGIRNKVGHSMAWPSRPSLEEYTNAFYLIVGALSATLGKLHP